MCTLLFMMARKHLMHTWISSLGSPILSLAACLLDLFLMSGLSTVSSDGRQLLLVVFNVADSIEHTPDVPETSATFIGGISK